MLSWFEFGLLYKTLDTTYCWHLKRNYTVFLTGKNNTAPNIIRSTVVGTYYQSVRESPSRLVTNTGYDESSVGLRIHVHTK